MLGSLAVDIPYWGQSLLRVLDNKSGNYYLDPEGKKMPPSKNFAARVLVATGNIAAYSTTFREKKRSSLNDVFQVAQKLTEDEFFEYCKTEMVKYKRPVEVHFVDALPKTGTNKINRRALRERV